MTPAPKRRWFQWSLRTMFVVVTVVACLSAWVVYQLNWIRQRHEFVAEHEARLRAVYAESWGFPKVNSATAPLGLWILGERGLAIVSVGIVHDGTKGKTSQRTCGLEACRAIVSRGTGHRRVCPS